MAIRWLKTIRNVKHTMTRATLHITVSWGTNSRVLPPRVTTKPSSVCRKVPKKRPMVTWVMPSRTKR